MFRVASFSQLSGLLPKFLADKVTEIHIISDAQRTLYTALEALAKTSTSQESLVKQMDANRRRFSILWDEVHEDLAQHHASIPEGGRTLIQQLFLTTMWLAEERVIKEREGKTPANVRSAKDFLGSSPFSPYGRPSSAYSSTPTPPPILPEPKRPDEGAKL